MQTPGGRKAWTHLAQMPEVTVDGLVSIESEHFSVDGWNNRSDKLVDQLMSVGFEFMGNDKENHYFLFPVRYSKDELKPLLNKSVFKVYGGAKQGLRFSTYLLARGS